MNPIKLTVLSLIFVIYGFLNSSFAQWVQVSNGMSATEIRSLASSGNNLLAGTGTYGIYLSTNNGGNWNQVTLNTFTVYAFGLNGVNIYAGTYNVYLSTNNGLNWSQTTLTNRTVYSLAVNGNNIFAGTLSFGIYLSTNNGTNWTQTSFPNVQAVYSLAVSGNVIFSGTYGNGVYLSTDNGTSWTQTSLNNRTILSLAVNGNNIFAGTQSDNGVYLSTNTGTNWVQTSLNNKSVSALAVNGNNIFAGSVDNGVYVSNNNGTSWTQRNEGLGNVSVNALFILNNYIFAGTASNSVYRRPLGELVGIQPISNEVPNQFSLSQNYPNPFNPTTKIRFSIPANVKHETSNTKMIIFDIIGKEVATLVNEQLNPGTYEAEWDASGYPSGVYFYRLETDDFTETKKMLLVK